MSPISKDQISDALLIVASILCFAYTALLAFQALEASSEILLSVALSGVVLAMIGGLIKRGTFDSWFTCSD